MIHRWNRRSFLNIPTLGHMHLSESAVKLYAFVYNYFSVKPQKRGLIVALLRTPLLTDPVDTYAKMSRKKHPFNPLINCIIDYDVSVKLTRKPLKMIEIANTTIH